MRGITGALLWCVSLLLIGVGIAVGMQPSWQAIRTSLGLSFILVGILLVVNYHLFSQRR